MSNYGFNNVLEDNDGVLRRYPLAVGQPAPCENGYAFSWLIASRYLAEGGIVSRITSEQYLQLGDTTFEPLNANFGGYQEIDARGHQVIINPRVTKQIAETMTLGQFLSNQTEPERVSDRIVLIGTSAPSFNDYRWLTAQSGGVGPLMTLTGTEVQAHLVSQLLSTVHDNRPLIWSWSSLTESIWIIAWSFTGGSIALFIQNRRSWILCIGSAVIILLGCCWAVAGLLLEYPHDWRLDSTNTSGICATHHKLQHSRGHFSVRVAFEAYIY